MPKSIIQKERLPSGFEYSEEYQRFVGSQEIKSGALSGLPPWSFAAEEEWALDKSEKLFGTKLIPFAQAEHQDKLAYFNATNCNEVWEADPWGGVVLGTYPSFSSWLNKVQKESAKFVSEIPQYQGKEFWYGRA
ncbi:MAG: hypothetical protein JAY90_19650 [Candidatus Thiodiazotropha lotti]|nr:hypothetical protein [Candidatus Thiodiazotropha lotti]